MQTVDPLVIKKYLDKMDIFKNEKYSVVKDLQSAFNSSLEKPMRKRLFEKLPDYVFWDIKVPLQ